MKNYSTILVGLALLVLTAGCNKDDGNSPTNGIQTEACYLTKLREGYSAQDAMLEAELVYDSTNRLIQINGFDTDGSIYDYHVYTYNVVGKITKVESFNSANEAMSYLSFNYDAQNRQTKKTWFYRSSPASVFEQGGYETYEYNGSNQLVKASYFEDVSTVSEGYVTYDYLNGNVIRSREHYAMQQGQAPSVQLTREFTYDNKRNPVKGIYADGLENEVRFSNNNVLSVTSKDANNTVIPERSSTFTYVYNTQGYPTQVDQQSFNNSTPGTQFFDYNCP